MKYFAEVFYSTDSFYMLTNYTKIEVFSYISMGFWYKQNNFCCICI